MKSRLMKVWLLILTGLIILGCMPNFDDEFQSIVFVSSKGEKAYINTLNWGVTGDSQLTTVTANKNLLKDRDDNADTVNGLTPFIVSFSNDTLNLYFHNEINYTPKEKFRTITIICNKVDANKYDELRQKAMQNDGYLTVPPTPHKS